MPLALCYVCERVLDKAAVKKCGRCKVSCYCSVECQTQDWKGGTPLPHKLTCQKDEGKQLEEVPALVDAGTTMKECLEKIRTRDPKAPCYVGVMKTLLARHSDPTDTFTLPEAVPQKPAPGEQAKPPPLFQELMQLADEINPNTATPQWLAQPAFLNLLFHDRIIDCSQPYLIWRQAEQDMMKDFQGSKEQAEKLIVLKFKSDNDPMPKFYSIFLLNVMSKAALLFNNNVGALNMKRLLWLVGHKSTMELCDTTLVPLLQILVQKARARFFECGGLMCIPRAFNHPKTRMFFISVLASVQKGDWMRFGGPGVVVIVMEEFIVPGLVKGNFDGDFFYTYQDVEVKKLGTSWRRNGGTSFSNSDSDGSCLTGQGFAPFGNNVMKNLVLAHLDFVNGKDSPKVQSPLVQALQVLTRDGHPRSIPFCYYLREVMGFESDEESKKKETDPSVQEEAKDGEEFERLGKNVTVESAMGAIDTWKHMSYAEKRKYYWPCYSPAQREALK